MVEIVYTLHAEIRIKERGILKDQIEAIILSNRNSANDGDNTIQSIIFKNSKKYVCRIFYVKQGNLFKVLTAYISSDLKRYGEINDR